MRAYPVGLRHLWFSGRRGPRTSPSDGARAPGSPPAGPRRPPGGRPGPRGRRGSARQPWRPRPPGRQGAVGVLIGPVTQGGGLVLRRGHDAVGPVIGHAHDVLPGHEPLGLLLGVLDEPFGLGPSLSQDGVGIGDDLLGATNGARDRVTSPVDEVQGVLPVDDRRGAHRHGSGVADELVELIEDAQQGLLRHRGWSSTVGPLECGRRDEAAWRGPGRDES